MSEYIRTFTGVKFQPLNPREKDVRIEDVAHGLAHICRWAGHVPSFYSVALHSIHVSEMVHPEHALAALLHDASESFLGDMAKPVKNDMPEYQFAENRLMSTIANSLGFEFPLDDEVKKADAAALYLEAKYFFPSTFVSDIPFTPSPIFKEWDFEKISQLTPHESELMFLAQYYRLKSTFIL